MDKAREAAQYLWETHQARRDYHNLPPELAPADTTEAYAIQDAFQALAAPSRGPVAGMKIATTTKVMQELMGIDHPCGGGIFANTIHRSPARLACADFINLRIECEIAIRVQTELSGRGPYTASNVREAVGEIMPAFELIEDRHAVYRETNALSMIADNCWNAGIVIGPAKKFDKSIDIDALRGRLAISGKAVAEGKADRPLEALAWLANLALERGKPIRKDMVVITGSVVATVSVAPGDTAVFTIDGLGEVRLELR
ncbi:MAG TPA: fumarylacetoacetate hydrolase family protein [Alphaproteobacteria bacterium]|nr:fumarylacetoacetate hydrolase family protein [Alphaproteobacteria bacterium]